jgi:hypothetical protein
MTRGVLTAILFFRAPSLVHDAMTEDAHVSILISRDRLATAHAARKEHEDGSSYIVDHWIIAARGNIHGCTLPGPAPMRQ